MKLNVWIKTRFADKALAPVRQCLIDLIPQGATVLDIGCGSGDLLFRAADKIAQGTGIDLDTDMFAHANQRAQISGITHLDFVQQDATTLTGQKFNIATSTLCLHELPSPTAEKVLRKMTELSDQVFIADYHPPKSLSAKLAIELDEMISGHYGRFRHYRQNGGLPGLAERCQLRVKQCVETSIDGIWIWEVSG